MPFIKVKIEQQNRESMNFEEMMQKAVNEKAKAGLRSSTMVRDSDIRCLRGYYSSKSTASKVQTQGTTAKNSCLEEPKIKEIKLILSQAAEASEPLN